MHSIEKGGIGSHGFWERLKQVRRLNQDINALINVTNEDHGGGCCFFLFASCKGSGGHVILHDLYSIFVLESDPGHFIKSYHVPQTHQAHLT